MVDEDLLLHYTAGFIDAEGCFRAMASGSKDYIGGYLTIVNSEIEVLKLIVNHFGGRIYTKINKEKTKRSKEKDKYRNVHNYNITGKELYSFIKLLIPRLKGKKREAALTLALLKTKQFYTKKYIVSDKTLSIRKRIDIKLRQIKKIDYELDSNIDYQNKDLSNLSNEFLAYLSGFIDGDGYIGRIVKYKKGIGLVPNIKIYNTNINLLLKIQFEIGGSLTKRKNKYFPSIKNLYTLTLNTQDSRLLLKKLIPFLIIKKKESLLFLEYIKNSPKKNNDRNIGEIVKEERHAENRVQKIEEYPSWKNTLDEEVNY